jgi:hypothetical protein
MRLMTIISVILVAVIVSGCMQVEDDGYLAPPTAAFDPAAEIERAHAALRGLTYLGVTKDQECREVCDVFERGFDHARTVRITKPSQCANQYEAGLWSQTEYQEGCRAYALTVLSLVDEYRKKHHEHGAS